MATSKVGMNRAGPSADDDRARWLDCVDLSSFFVRAPAVLLLLDPDLKILMSSDRLAEACGLSLREVLGKTPAELFPDISPRVDEILRCVADTGRPHLNFEVAGELPTSPGVLRHWKASCFPAGRAQDGRFAIGVILTETSNRAPESLLPRTESRLRELLTLARLGTWEANFLTGRDIWSQQVYNILGLDLDTSASFELFRSLVHPHDREMLDLSRAMFRAHHQSFDLPLRIIRPNGEGRVIRCCGTKVCTPEGHLAGVIGLIQDVTSQYEAERAVRESEERMKALIGSIDEAVFEFDAEGTVLNVWTRNEELLVAPPSELLGKKGAELVGEEYFARFRPIFQRVLETGRAENVEGQLRVRAGDRWFLARITPVPSADGESKTVCLLARDITERKRVEQTLHHLSTRLLSIQDEERHRTAQFLHETTAHSLLAVKLNLQAAARKNSLDDKVRNILLDSLDLIEGAMQEIRTLSYVLHPPMLDESGLPSAVRWFVTGFSERSGISVGLEMAEDFGRFPREIEMMMFRVITESLSNIHRHSGSSSATIRLRRDPGEITVEIQDVGRGISPDRLAAAESGVLGVGIVGMRERVGHQGGKLTISSEVGHGTKVRVTLPVEAAARASAATA
jgi:PAS domain S-box-containing protein